MAIIDLIKAQLGPEFISQAATHLGESESKVSKAVKGLLPAVLGGLAENAQNLTVLSSISDSAAMHFNSIKLLEEKEAHPMISQIISSIFGDHLEGLQDTISKYSKAKTETVNLLLHSIIGATIGAISKYASENHLDTPNTSKILVEQKEVLSSLLPAELSWDSFGMENLLDPKKENRAKDSKTTSRTASSKQKESTSTSSSIKPSNNKEHSFWKWLLPLILLGMAAWFVWKQYYQKEAPPMNQPKIDSPMTDKNAAMQQSQKIPAH